MTKKTAAASTPPRNPRAKSDSKASFLDAIEIIKHTARGQEAAMYPSIRDLFCDVLGYPKSSVLTDVAGEDGRPDLTVRAPSGLKESIKGDALIDWIVVEAKDEHDAFTAPDRREDVFAKKVKYVGPDTDWFVMCDPKVIVARNVRSPEIAADNDIVFRLDGSETEEAFLKAFASLAYDVAGVPERLRAFRAGDPKGIACEKLMHTPGAKQREINRVILARRNFYTTLRRTTRQLQESTLAALKAVKPILDETILRAKGFEAKYEVCEFTAYPLSVRGNPRSYEKTKTHDRDAATLRRYLAKHPMLSRLALQGLPDFRIRTGIADENKVLELFATETANLVLARILLVRFLEDHGFFGTRKYVCNGGVKAFREVMAYFGHGYTKLLEEAYRSASQLYAAAFDETELDWIFAADDERLSGAIEWTMYQLSRYDFTTVKGDILTGVYDRFLDKKQRKAFGEYYTPPSIARYILDRLDLPQDARILDPACGSGTFLIERYQQVVGEDADRGLAMYADAVAAFGRIAGNDINTFSAVLAQIQLLWHLLIFRDELIHSEFPDIGISEKANSLAQTNIDEPVHHRFSEMDMPDYDAVVGNPPYVRSESGSELDQRTREYFSSSRQKPSGIGAWSGISPDGNIFGLFIYRALDSWCRQPDQYGDGAGRLGFVIPLSFCGNDENTSLRELFGPGGRWTIRELVDIEAIWRYVFDADVLPLIFIAEARPPRLPLKEEWLTQGAEIPSDKAIRRRIRRARLHRWMEARRDTAIVAGKADLAARWAVLIDSNRPSWEPDRVSVRLADRSCLEFHDGEKRPHFAMDRLPENLVDYADIFSPDGRILTRITASRRRIIDKLTKAGKLEQAALRYWVRREKNRLVEASLDSPPTGAKNWIEKTLITRGLVFRGNVPQKPDGYPVYKGENVVSCSLFGEPQAINVDTIAVNDPSVWRFPNVLPKQMFAIAQIMTCPSAVAFDPHSIAFTDTVTLFAPNANTNDH